MCVRVMTEDVQVYSAIAHDTWKRSKALSGQVMGVYTTLKRNLSSSSSLSSLTSQTSSSPSLSASPTPMSFVKGGSFKDTSLKGHLKGALKTLSRSISSSALSSLPTNSPSPVVAPAPAAGPPPLMRRSVSESNLSVAPCDRLVV